MSTYCASALIVAKARTGADGDCLRSSAMGSIVTICAKVERYWALTVAAFGGARACDCVLNTGGIMSVNRGGDFA